VRARGASGIKVIKRLVRAGVAAEATALVGIGVILLLVFREQDFSSSATRSAPRPRRTVR